MAADETDEGPETSDDETPTLPETDWDALTPAVERVAHDADEADEADDSDHDSIGDDTAMEETLGDAIAEAER